MQWTETMMLKVELLTSLCTLRSDARQAVKILNLTDFFFPLLKDLGSLMPLQHQTLTLQAHITLHWLKQ